MPHIDAVLPLYPDLATRQTLLELAVAQTRTDLADMRRAIDAGDHASARQQVHRAKGTASFLGRGEHEIQAFDLLADALRAQDMTRIGPAFMAVEAALRELEAMLLTRLNQLPGTVQAAGHGHINGLRHEKSPP
ncbi:Hpt domain-containing protein [Bordetella sp. BOR01]|uniref:Hpt domain-containing protein n=1 Tax=Bordetella sp. BOR01 TaxID=2854779 RepID=UPI001C46C887|nr:Hpt domain-containing protein [Bordetella sp. BOR01]MBV7485603.1 Hpt domain-containing protein [Bordetella sp. BOR01]